MQSILTCFILLCTCTILGQTASLRYKGGTYSFGKQNEEGVFATIKIRPVDAEKAVFCLNVEQGAPSYGTGMILGVMRMQGTVAVYEKKDNDYMDCKLKFDFNDDQLTITTLDGRKEYGFGDSMHPNYIYKLTNKSIPVSYVSDEGKLMPLLEAYASMVAPDYYYTPRGNDLWSSGQVRIGSTIAKNQIWYKNDSLNQVTVVIDNLDNNYRVWLHFYKDSIPDDLMDHVEFTRENNERLTLEQKKIDIPVFVDQAVTTLDAEFFESVRGVNLGDLKSKAIGMYGDPDWVLDIGGYERLIWIFSGESDFNPEVDPSDMNLVEDSLGFIVAQYYKDGKLFAQILTEVVR